MCESHSPSHPSSKSHALLLPDPGAGPGPSAPGRQPSRDLSKACRVSASVGAALGPGWGLDTIKMNEDRETRPGAHSQGPDYGVRSFPVAAITDCHELGGLQQWQHILSQLWGPQSWNQGVGRAPPPPETLGDNPSLPLPAPGDSSWLLGGVLGWWQSLSGLCLCLHGGVCFVALCVSVSSHLLRRTPSWGLGHTLNSV